MDFQDYKKVDFGMPARKEPVYCDTHPQEIAQTVCLGKKLFLCLDCVINKEPEWIVTKIDKIKDEKDNAMVDCMYTRQEIRNVLNTHLEYERKTLKKKENVREEVLKFHKKLSDKLDEMKDKTLKKIDEMTKRVLENPLRDKSKLKELESNIEEVMKLLEEETDKATCKVSTTIQNVHASLEKDLAKLTAEPSQVVELNKSLEQAFYQPNTLLAIVSFSDLDPYDEIGNPDSGASGETTKTEAASLQEKNEDIAFEEPIYKEVTAFQKTVNIQPKHLLNKSLQLSCLDSKFPTACKFSKIFYLEKGRMAMLSKQHSLVVVVGLDNTLICSECFKTPIHNMAALNKDTIAVLSNTHIIKYGVGNKGFQICDAFQIDQQDFTGFDYDQKKSKFAISSENKLSVFDKSGQNKKEYDFPKCGSSHEITTAYDFENDNICFIDKQRQVLGCYSVKSKKNVFKKKRFDFLVRDLYVGNGILFVSSESAVYLFSSSDGKAIIWHKADDLVVDCSAVCEADGVIIVASESNDMEKSKQLGFISV